MVEVSIEGDRAVFEIAGSDTCWSFQTRFDIPLAYIRSVTTADLVRAAERFGGLKLAGTGVPYVFRAGHYQSGDFGIWEVQHPEHTVIIELADDRYSELVIEVENPAEVVGLLEGALGWRGSAESDALPKDPSFDEEFEGLGFDTAKERDKNSADDDPTLTIDGLEHLYGDVPSDTAARLASDALLSIGDLDGFFGSLLTEDDSDRLTIDGLDLFERDAVAPPDAGMPLVGGKGASSSEPAPARAEAVEPLPPPVAAIIVPEQPDDGPAVAGTPGSAQPSPDRSADGTAESSEEALPGLVKELAVEFRRLSVELNRMMRED